MTDLPKVLVLAHSDVWGALSANQLLPKLKGKADVIFVVSKATKDENGDIKTAEPLLRVPRALKETAFSDYLNAIDRTFNPDPKKSLLSFKALASEYAFDGKVHYTTCGGFKGGQEVLEILNGLSITHSMGMPDVALSVDTMAILPAEIVELVRCFSAHPGPLDGVKIEGMQGTLRSVVNGVYFDSNGNRLPDGTTRRNRSDAHIGGTLFLQSPVLDQGTNIHRTYTHAAPDACVYSLRVDVYRDLVNAMIEYLPQLLDPQERERLIENARSEASSVPGAEVIEIPSLRKGRLVKSWAATTSEENKEPLMSVAYFKGQMRRFYPYHEGFVSLFDDYFGDFVQELDGVNKGLKDSGVAADRPVDECQAVAL